jgi:hypothetical protein
VHPCDPRYRVRGSALSKSPSRDFLPGSISWIGIGVRLLFGASANPVTEKTGTIVRGCEVACGTVKSGSKFHARCARTEIQQAILGTDVACGGERTPLLYVIEVLAGYRRGRGIAYRKPNLSAVRLVHIVCGSWTAHLGRHPTWLQSIGKHTRPSSGNRERQQHVMELRVGVGLLSPPGPGGP